MLRKVSKEKTKEYASKFYLTHKEQVKEEHRKYYLMTKDRSSQRSKLYYENNKIKSNEASKLWRLKNKEKISAYLKQYYIDHKQEHKEKAGEWYELNKDKVKADVKKWRTNNINKKKDYNHQRRARMMNNGYEEIDIKEIYDRDLWVCQLCKNKVDKKLKYPHPQSASLDHIIPISLGGGHLKNNVQLTHLVCNFKAQTGGIKQTRLF